MDDVGSFTVQANRIHPGVVLHFSERGQQIAEALRAHKPRGGAFANFTPHVCRQQASLTRVRLTPVSVSKKLEGISLAQPVSECSTEGTHPKKL